MLLNSSQSSLQMAEPTRRSLKVYLVYFFTDRFKNARMDCVRNSVKCLIRVKVMFIKKESKGGGKQNVCGSSLTQAGAGGRT